MNNNLYNVILKIVLKAVSVILLTAIMAAILMFSFGYIIANGPSEEAKYGFITRMEKSPLTSSLLLLYFSKNERDAIKEAHYELVNTRLDSSEISLLDNSFLGTGDTEFVGDEEGNDEGIEVISIEGNKYSAKMMIVSDPSRVFVGTLKNGYNITDDGETVYSIVKNYNATAGIGASAILGYEGSIPDGVIISNGELMWGREHTYYHVAGIDSFGILHVGRMTLEEISRKGLMNAVSFGPSLIIDGEPQIMTESLKIARTAIGQRSDGAILLLTITPLEMEDAGATYNDLIDIFTEYDAINAANLYCQPEPTMIYKEQNIASGSLSTDTPVAAAILVK